MTMSFNNQGNRRNQPAMRKSLWRFALVGGMLWQEPAWAQPPVAPPVIVQAAPVASQPPLAVKPAEKTVAFNMEGQRWSTVFQWLVDQTGLKYGSSYIPQGSFTFKSPIDRKYTISEVIDIINEALDSNPDQQRFLLIRRETSFVLVPADEKIDPTLIPRVAPEDLDRRGSTEVVSVVIGLGGAVAEDVAPELKKLLGKYGDVVTLGRANQLVIQDTAGNLKRLLRIIKEMDTAEKGQDSLTHDCKFIKAREAERILTSLLGSNTPNASGAPQQPFDPRRGPMPAAAPVSTRSRQHFVASDERTNTVLVSGPADKIAQARDILKRIDVGGPGQQPVMVGPPILKQYSVAPGSAEAVSKTLQDIYKNSPSIRVSPVGTASVMVYAGPEDQIEVARQIQGTATIEKITKTELVPLSGDMDATKIVDTLKGMLGDVKTGAPYVEADTNRNAIVVRGTAEQVQDVQSIVRALGAGGISGGNVRVINIEKGSASILAEHLQKLMPNMRQNPVQVINPTAVPTPPPAPRNTPFQPVPNRPVPQGMGRLGDPQPVDSVVQVSAQVVPQGQPAAVPAKPGRPDAPLRISVIGNRLVISCDDPEALALANEIIRIMTQSPAGEGDYEVIRLRNAGAAAVAKILDEAFNGTGQASGGGQQGGGGGIGGAFGGRFNPLLSLAGLGGASAQSTPNRVRVVADPASNTLLVRANPLDMLSIKSLLEKALDNAETDSNAVGRTWTIGPLVNTQASEVANTIRDVYGDLTKARSTSSNAGGFRGMGFFPPFGGGQDQSAQAAKPTALSIGVDERSNSLLLFCSQALYEDIGKLVDYLELSAKPTSTKTVKVISVKGIDPALVQQAVDAIQGRTGARRQGTGVGSGMGGTGGGGFNPGGFGTGGGGFGRGGRGGGMGIPQPRSETRDPDFFKGQVRNTSPLFDPQSISQVSFVAEDALQVPGQQPPAQPQPARQPGAPVAEQPAVVGFSGVGDSAGVKGPKEQVTVESLPQLGVLILSGSSAADVEAMIQIIDTIQKLGVASDLQIQVVTLEEGDATSIASTLTDLYRAVVVSASGNSRAAPRQPQQGGQPQGAPQIGGFPFGQGGQQGGAGQQGNRSIRAETTEQLSSVVLVPVPRLNAIILAAPKARIEEVVKDLKKLDVPVSNKLQATPISLTKAPAARVSALITNFYAQRYPGEQAIEHQVRVTHDDSSNTVFVQASPADMAEIKELIKRLDTAVSSAVNDIRIIPLRYAFADELASVVQRAISQGVVAPTSTTGVVQAGGGQQGGGGGQQGGGLAALFGGQGGQGGQGGFGQQNQQNRTTTSGAAGAQFKSTSLRFVGTQRDGKPVQSGLLEDIFITPEARINSLIISAPEKSLELILSLVKELDVPPATRAEINIFQLRKADAVITANIVQQLFLGSSSQRAGGNAGGQGGAGGAGGLTGFGAQGGQGFGGAQGQGANNTQGRPLQFSNLSQPSPGGPLIDLRLTVDERSNSIVVAGSRSDLDVIEAIIARLEDSDVQTRKNDVYILRNSVAPDVAAALNNFLTSTLRNLQNSQQLTSYQQLDREVIIVAEPISNKLLISATPRWHGEIMRLIAELDAEQPQVVIQVLIAEIKLTGTEEFGVEIGLQSPVLFKRGIYPADGISGTSTIAGSATQGSLLPAGVTVNSSNPVASPGYNFLNPAASQGNNPLVQPSVVGFQGINALGTGRVGANGVGGFVFSAAADSFNLLIRALKTQGRIDILSRPQVTALDNQQARVFVGQNYPLILGSNVTNTGIISNNVQYQAVGVELLVTPKITPDGRVIMRVAPQVSKPTPTNVTLGNGVFATAIDQQIIETTVIAMDGETVALGGLIKKTDAKQENKIPWFGDLPYVGSAFRYRNQQKEKQELMIILTPHIVRNKWDAARILSEEARRMDWLLSDVAKTHGAQGLLPPVSGPGGMPGSGGQNGPDNGNPQMAAPPGILSVPATVPMPLPVEGGIGDQGKPIPRSLPSPSQPDAGPGPMSRLPGAPSMIQQAQAVYPAGPAVPVAQSRPFTPAYAPLNSAPMSASSPPVQPVRPQENASWQPGNR